MLHHHQTMHTDNQTFKKQQEVPTQKTKEKNRKQTVSKQTFL